MTVLEAILVEGRYDAHTVRQAVEATVVEAGGFGLFKRQDLRKYLQTLASQKGLILLTDSDGAGFLIRHHIQSFIPAGQIKQAYVPDRVGKERRKAAPSREGLLGVEGMPPEIIREALFRAGATILGHEAADRQRVSQITKADFYEWGLSGAPDSAERRIRVASFLGFPARLSAKGLLHALNAFFSREQAEKEVETALRSKSYGFGKNSSLQ